MQEQEPKKRIRNFEEVPLGYSKEDAIYLYRESLAACGYAYPSKAWDRDLGIGLLAGGAMRLIWQKALPALPDRQGGAVSDDPAARARNRAELEWWSDQIVNAARWLE